MTHVKPSSSTRRRIKRFLFERRHVLRPWTGTRRVAPGAAGSIDYLHPFLNQMLDYENKGLVRNGVGKWFRNGRVSCLFMLIVGREDQPCKGCLEYRHVAQVE